jgi:hypothetical protein
MDRETKYDLVVYGNLMLTALYIQIIQEQNKRHTEPDFDWVPIVAASVACVSAAGMRTRMYAESRQTADRYDAELLKAFCYVGFGLVIPWHIARKAWWHYQANKIRKARG